MITEFATPSGINPQDITAGPDGNVWFTLPFSMIGKITPAGIITEYTTPTSGSFPDSLTSGPDGNLWFTEIGADQIGQITPAGVITEYPIPTSGGFPSFLTTGPDGNLWFALPGVSKIGKITPAGVITEYTAPSGLNHITAGPVATCGLRPPPRSGRSPPLE